MAVSRTQVLRRHLMQQQIRTTSTSTKDAPHLQSAHVVDAWAQPADASFVEGLPEVKRLLFQSGSPAQTLIESGAGPKEHAELLDKAGVSRVLLSAWRRPGKSILTNERIAEYVKAFPNHFVGIGTVQLDKPMTAVREVEQCVKEYGFKGIRILPWLWDKPPTSNYYYPVFAKCVELGVPFLTQVGHTGPLCPSEPGRPVPYIDQVALDFPDLKIIGGHIGHPWTDEMIGVAWKHENVYIDTSAHAPRYYPPQLIHFMNSYGSPKVLFGTNFPQLTFDMCVKQAKQLPLSKDAFENFMWKNANRIFGLDLE